MSSPPPSAQSSPLALSLRLSLLGFVAIHAAPFGVDAACFVRDVVFYLVSGTSSNYDNSIEFSGASSCSAGKSPISGVQDPNKQISRTPGLKEYSVADLKIATNNFSPDSLLGEGDFGRVYKGWIYEKTLAPSSKRGTGMAVAIKILNPDGFQGFDEWQSEVNFLGRHYHPNVIGLIGYCWEAEMLVLVCEFMQKGSLENHLFGRSGAIKPLSWDIRLKIAIGAARGLAFLHTLEKKVIHRDLKTSNILLDENYNVKLSNFGLAMRGPCDEESHINTSVMGTYGYAAPEYIATGNIYLKSDVYGFGVVLLELLTGLRALDKNRPHRNQNLVEWLKPKLCQKKKLRTIMDVHMEGQYPTTAAFQAAELTQKCLDLNPQNRPSMKEVVEVLKEVEAMEEETNNSKV
ncbi:hypothetical protein LWI29_026896 [Acer saccharum]|uniref:non-specific serine/threonine protein kinase n=1 Tax=Acer saccharum TaxID=4024 RepID=A0AA39THA2_ACESA|nr:hypothetical protein LWI29_026896 [Acer saccharum]